MHDEYDAFVARSPQGSVFSTAWWLDAVAPGRWRPHALETDGEVVAAWPTVVSRSRWGLVHAGAPLTPFLGPHFVADGNPLKRRSREIKQLELLVAEIEPCAHIEARCHPAFDYWTPLAWHGFTQTTHYTWRLPDLGDLDAVFRATRENIRREVRKAEKRGVTVEDATIAEFLSIHAETAAHKGIEDGGAEARRTLERIEAAAAQRGARDILLARDGDGRVHAGGYFVRDEHYAYYLSGGSDPAVRTSGASSLLLWRAVERAAERGLGFDFEGSMLLGVERFFRAFGGVPVPRSVVRNTPSAALRLLRPVKRAVRSRL